MHVFTPYWDNVTEGQICNKVITLLLPLSRKVAQKSVMLLFWCALNLKMQKPSLSFSIGICNCKNQWYLKSKLIYIVLSSEKLLLQRKIISFFIFKRKNIGCQSFRSTFRAVEVKMNFQNQILWWVPSLLPEGLLTLSPFSIIYGPKYEGWQTNGLKSEGREGNSLGSQVEEEKSILKLWVLFVLSVDIILWEMGGMGEQSGDTALLGLLRASFSVYMTQTVLVLSTVIQTLPGRPPKPIFLPHACSKVLLRSICIFSSYFNQQKAKRFWEDKDSVYV